MTQSSAGHGHGCDRIGGVIAVTSPPRGEDPDDQPGDKQKKATATILTWIPVASGFAGLVTEILRWFNQ